MSETTPVINDWGAWSLGDLADLARRVAELLGASAVVDSVVLGQPGAEQLPKVLVSVSDETEVAELREAVQHTEYVVEFFGPTAPWAWQAETAGLCLAVETEGAWYDNRRHEA